MKRLLVEERGRERVNGAATIVSRFDVPSQGGREDGGFIKLTSSSTSGNGCCADTLTQLEIIWTRLSHGC
jgi:hypothetical protein